MCPDGIALNRKVINICGEHPPSCQKKDSWCEKNAPQLNRLSWSPAGHALAFSASCGATCVWKYQDSGGFFQYRTSKGHTLNREQPFAAWFLNGIQSANDAVRTLYEDRYEQYEETLFRRITQGYISDYIVPKGRVYLAGALTASNKFAICTEREELSNGKKFFRLFVFRERIDDVTPIDFFIKPTCIVWGNNNSSLAIGFENGDIKVYRSSDMKLDNDFKYSNRIKKAITCISWSSDDSMLAYCSNESMGAGVVSIYPVQDDMPLLKHGATVSSVSIMGQGLLVATKCVNGKIVLWRNNGAGWGEIDSLSDYVELSRGTSNKNHNIISFRRGTTIMAFYSHHTRTMVLMDAAGYIDGLG